MAFSIYRVIDLAGGKITAEIVDNTQGLVVVPGQPYKFTFVKSSDLDISTSDSQEAIEFTFKYKDNF